MSEDTEGEIINIKHSHKEPVLSLNEDIDIDGHRFVAAETSILD
jgi:hypothetical protein